MTEGGGMKGSQIYKNFKILKIYKSRERKELFR